MSEWWLFRNTRIENVNEQHEIAANICQIQPTGSAQNTTTST